MRLWSIHPKYLDAKGLVALWREGLLALAVLEGKTNGYRNHPQLERFRAEKDPVGALVAYLNDVYSESVERGYSFDKIKINKPEVRSAINVSSGQIDWEKDHLLSKLIVRDKEQYSKLAEIKHIDPHPLCKIYIGRVELWEKGADLSTYRGSEPQIIREDTI